VHVDYARQFSGLPAAAAARPGGGTARAAPAKRRGKRGGGAGRGGDGAPRSGGARWTTDSGGRKVGIFRALLAGVGGGSHVWQVNTACMPGCDGPTTESD